MKKFNLAALPLAVAGVLASTSAFAGTEACFEVYKDGGAGLVTAHATLYQPASCEATRAGATATTLQANLNPTVAWELTGDVELPLSTLGTENTNIVYIPTTDIPPASRIRMQLTGADFGTVNANQIYLVQDDGAFFQTVASSDGIFNDTDTVEFLTKAGVTIGAGTRLVLSTNNPDGTVASSTTGSTPGINIHVANSETCAINPVVSIRATSALTDSSTVIVGGVSSTKDVTESGGFTTLVDISEQFSLVATNLVNPNGPNASREILVDAEDPSFRKSFVNNGQAGTPPTWDNQVIAQKAFWEAKFVNKNDTLDMFVTLDPSDTVSVSISADSATGDGVTFGILAANNATDSIVDASILDDEAVDHIDATLTSSALIDITGSTTNELPLTTTPTAYSALASQYFGSVAANENIVNVAATLTNDATKVMDFNYTVNTSWSMNFTNASQLDKNGCQTPSPFNVGVNGAVLKVPYVYTKANEGGFVRITSEHTTQATIFMDIFDESSNETKNVNVGTLAAKASNVLKADDLLALAIADGYVGTGDRHTMTFTVTAPKNKVHGVSVQKIAGGVDRVMPVLDQNDWSQ
jgi:hypothetical protein